MAQSKPPVSAYEKIREHCRQDRRYHPYAYAFVKQCVEFASKAKEGRHARQAHIPATELLEAVRGVALREFGYLAKTVLNYWGVHKTEDIGEIVFAMFSLGLLGQSPNDKKSDFGGGFTFHEAFVDNYVFPTELEGDSTRRRL